MQYERRQVRRSLDKAGQAAFLALGMGFASLFGFAANSCFTFCPDGIGINLIEIGCISEDIRAVRPRDRDEDGGFDQQTREGSFVGSADECDHKTQVGDYASSLNRTTGFQRLAARGSVWLELKC